MINLQLGVNRIVIPRLDMPNPMPDYVMLRLLNTATQKEAWCMLVDSGLLSDWHEFQVEVMGANADKMLSQIALTTKDRGEYLATIYGNSSYSESPSLNIELRKERCAFL